MTPNGLAKRIEWPFAAFEIEWTGCPPELFPYLRNAIDNRRVTVVSYRQAEFSAEVVFDYLGFRYELTATMCRKSTEMTLYPTGIEKIARVDEVWDEETNAVDPLHVTDCENGPQIMVVEDFRAQRSMADPRFGTW